MPVRPVRNYPAEGSEKGACATGVGSADSKGRVMNSATPVRKDGIERLAASPRRDQEYDLEDVFKVLRRRLGVIAGTVLLLTTGATLIALNLTPRYTARSTIVVEPRPAPLLEETRQDLPADTSTINTLVKFLTSNSFYAHKVIEQLDRAGSGVQLAARKDNAPDRFHRSCQRHCPGCNYRWWPSAWRTSPHRGHRTRCGTALAATLKSWPHQSTAARPGRDPATSAQEEARGSRRRLGTA